MYQLYAPGPAFGFSSFDPLSQAVQLFLNLVGAEWELIKTPPYLTSSQKLPILKDGTLYINGATNIMNHLEKEGFKLNFSLSEEQELKAFATAFYLSSKLQDVTAYYRYIDQNNFINVTRPTLSKILPLIACYHVPGKLVDQAQERLEPYQQCVEVEVENRKKFQLSRLSLEYLKARNDSKALDPLEARILEVNARVFDDIALLLKNDSKFLFGENLSKFDLIIGCQIAHILNPSMTNMKHAEYVKSRYPYILDYCNKITTVCGNMVITQSKNCDLSWSLPNFGIPKWIKSIYCNIDDKEGVKSSPEEAKLAKNRAYSIITAVVAMSAYIIYHGLLASGEEIIEEEYDDSLEFELDD